MITVKTHMILIKTMPKMHIIQGSNLSHSPVIYNTLTIWFKRFVLRISKKLLAHNI
jgi:hypothetical protein